MKLSTRAVCKTLLFLSILVFAVSVPKVYGLEPTAEIYPSKGTIFTDIFLKVRGLDKYVEGEFAPAAVGLELYVFWDDKAIITRMGDIVENSYHLHIFDASFRPPNEYPYSELGNHTIFGEVWKSSQFCWNFTLTFEIVEYYPPPSEWWKWWESVPDEIKQELVGPQGIQGEQGPIGPQGEQGIQGPKGEQGDSGPYPLEAVLLNLGLSSVSLIVFVITLSMFYKMKKELKNAG